MTATLVEIDPAAIAAGGGRPFRFTHRLVGDARLGLDALADLAGRLPRASIEMNEAGLPDVFPSDHVPDLDLAPADLVRRLAEMERWAALSNVEQDRAYRDLMDECLGPIRTGLASFEGGVTECEGYVFISAARSTTPAHLDFEHNVFLQVEGTKEITVGFLDPDAEARTLEGMHGGHYGRAPYLPDSLETFHLEPGEGMYISPGLVHLVHNVGGTVSVSLSLVMHTPVLDRGSRVYAANRDLRRFGLDPKPPGGSVARDAAKSAAVVAWRRAKGIVGRN